jgi:hypothetical protein
VNNLVEGLRSEGSAYKRGVADVALGKSVTVVLKVRGDVVALDGRIVEVVEIVNNRNPLAGRQKTINQMRSNKPGPAGDQD